MQAIAYRRWSIGEMLLLFVAGPAVLARLVYDQHIPLLVILPIVFAGLMTVLFRQVGMHFTHPAAMDSMGA